jgi:hypothetical protein
MSVPDDMNPPTRHMTLSHRDTTISTNHIHRETIPSHTAIIPSQIHLQAIAPISIWIDGNQSNESRSNRPSNDNHEDREITQRSDQEKLNQDKSNDGIENEGNENDGQENDGKDNTGNNGNSNKENHHSIRPRNPEILLHTPQLETSQVHISRTQSDQVHTTVVTVLCLHKKSTIFWPRFSEVAVSTTCPDDTWTNSQVRSSLGRE